VRLGLGIKQVDRLIVLGAGRQRSPVATRVGLSACMQHAPRWDPQPPAPHGWSPCETQDMMRHAASGCQPVWGSCRCTGQAACHTLHFTGRKAVYRPIPEPDDGIAHGTLVPLCYVHEPWITAHMDPRFQGRNPRSMPHGPCSIPSHTGGTPSRAWWRGVSIHV
jgi:hypothetical protein